MLLRKIKLKIKNIHISKVKMMNLMDGKSIKKIIKIDSFKSPEIFYKKKEINILNTSCLKMSEA